MADDVWFTSDTHFGHEGIIKLCKRPWANPYAMNEGLIEAWNGRVRPGDRVYHLGDFSFMRAADTRSMILPRLHGQIHVVEGNHDKQLRGHSDAFASWHKMRTLKVEGQMIVLCHFPLLEWEGAHRGWWHLHGHTHGNLGYDTQPRMDVGVDAAAGYAPLSMEQVRTYMRTREFTPVSHHKPKGVK